MSLRAGLICAVPEVWQSSDGSWNWVLHVQPDPMKPAFVLWDSTPYAEPAEALADCDRTVLSWLNRPAPWNLQ